MSDRVCSCLGVASRERDVNSCLRLNAFACACAEASRRKHEYSMISKEMNNETSRKDDEKNSNTHNTPRQSG